MKISDRVIKLFDEAKELDLINPITGDGMPTLGMIEDALHDAFSDGRQEGWFERDQEEIRKEKQVLCRHVTEKGEQ